VSAFRTLLVPIDFSEHADAALDLAIELARESGGTLHLFHAYELPVGTVPPYGVAIPESVLSHVREESELRLEKAASRVREAGVHCQTHLMHATPSDGILEAVEEIGADLIVMGTRGLTGLKHAILGSVAERTVRLAPCAVLTVKPGR
jgi:nucleotide-binding universal stress UspA family protein